MESDIFPAVIVKTLTLTCWPRVTTSSTEFTFKKATARVFKLAPQTRIEFTVTSALMDNFFRQNF
jgi:hypothetical protein